MGSSGAYSAGQARTYWAEAEKWRTRAEQAEMEAKVRDIAIGELNAALLKSQTALTAARKAIDWLVEDQLIDESHIALDAPWAYRQIELAQQAQQAKEDE